MAEEKTSEVMESKEIPKSKTQKLWILPTVLSIVLAATSGYFAWAYMKANNEEKDFNSKVDQLSAQVEKLKQELTSKDSASGSNSEDTLSDSSSTSQKVTLTDSQIENIVAAFNTMNAQPLESYMAQSVSVILAASEFQAAKTPAEAVASLSYLESATAPWDFNLPPATLATYVSNQYYGQYFGEDTLVGRASSKQIVTLHLNSSAKIDRIFMAINENLITE